MAEGISGSHRTQVVIGMGLVGVALDTGPGPGVDNGIGRGRGNLDCTGLSTGPRIGSMGLRIGSMGLRIGSMGPRIGSMGLRIGRMGLRIGSMGLRTPMVQTMSDQPSLLLLHVHSLVNQMLVNRAEFLRILPVD